MSGRFITLRFGPFEADCRTGELRKNGVRIRLAPQSFQVLVLLAERGSELTTREDMQRVLWPNQTIVDFDHSINTAIQRIRAALSDSRESPRYIETLSRRGYRFLAAVERLDLAGSAQPVSAGDRAGETVGQYRILDVLGQGGMGIVYKAQDIRLGRMVALKFLSPDLDSDEGSEDRDRSGVAMERLAREARTASSLNHPNVCTIYDVETHQTETFIAMEYLEGRTLRERLSQSGAAAAIAPDELVHIAMGIAGALSAAHEGGIIHRDIKPENIFLTHRGEVKVLDFGLATARGTGSADRPTRSGTAGYMSPEQERGELLDGRTDLFSLGVVIEEMVAGREHGFEGLRRLVVRLREQVREKRLQTAVEVMEALKEMAQAGEPRNVQSRHRLGRLAAATAGVLILAATIIGGYRYSITRGGAQQKGSVVIAEFTNSTGDEVFDATLRLGLAAQLEQSPYLNIVSDRRISQTLQLMEQSATARLTADLARQVCQRSSSAAAIDGSISSLGRQYVLTLTATNCQSGETLAREQAAADSKEQVLVVLGNVAGRIRSALGESISSIKQYNASIEDVTTPSLEALRSYSLGARAFWGSNDSRAAVPFYERAIELDPKFAMAYLRLGGVYDEIGVGETRLSTPYFEKAFAARDRVSARERYDISSRYYEAIGDMPKAAEICELWAQTYPGDLTPVGRMANMDLLMGQHKQALAHVVESRRRAGDGFRSYGNLAAAYLNLNRFDDVRKTIDEAGPRKLEPFLYLYFLDYLNHDASGMQRVLEWAARNPEVEEQFLNLQSDTLASAGRLRSARELSGRAIAVAKRKREDETAAAYLLNSALREAEFGNSARACEEAEAALEVARSAHGNALAALVFARAGAAGRARTLAGELAAKYPTSTPLSAFFLPSIHAAIAIDSKNAPQALRELEATAQFDLAAPSPLVAGTLYPVYLRGEAYRQQGQAAQAIQETMKFMSHRGTVRNFPLGALAHLQLARAYAVQGDGARARAAYRDFFTVWRDADQDVPILQQARNEFRDLQ